MIYQILKKIKFNFFKNRTKSIMMAIGRSLPMPKNDRRSTPEAIRWNSVTNGDIFNFNSTNSQPAAGCYFNDGKTYIVIFQY